MIGRRATVVLSLLCALAFCAFAAQSASAAAGKNTTAFTCIKVEAKTGDFADAHCDTKAAEGDYAHLSVGLAKTKITISNEETKNSTTESTPAVLGAEPFKVKIEISCAAVSGEGTQSNEEPEEKRHRVKATATINLTKCTAIKPAKCTVKEPIEMKVQAESVEELGASKNEMGTEFRPESGETLTTISFQGAECSLKGQSFKVEGTMIATGGTATQTDRHAGATGVFTNAMTSETLKVSEKPADYSALTTVRVAPKEGVKQNPVALTTVT
jgi:hypothetical protein